MNALAPVHDWLINTWMAQGWPGWVWHALWTLVLGVIIALFLVTSVILLVWMERKVAGDIQSRLGPIRVGPFGLLQCVADALKLLLKEDIIPKAADKPLFVLAPMVVFIPALMVMVALPFSERWIVSDLNIGILYIAAISSISVLGLIMAGWGSNNKWALLGGMRSAAQLISYEVPMVLAMVSVVMMAGSLSTVRIVQAQSSMWYIIQQPLAFLIFFIAALAETNRTPFDLPEAESELVAGFHVEYSGMRFAFFFLGEYVHLFFISAFAATLFLGGWQGPILPPAFWLLLKTGAIIFVAMWLRWTLPRLRVDQMMGFAWKVLIPAALLNLVITALLVVGR
jgi:NADH-quinone oxidoreductase subunit H